MICKFKCCKEEGISWINKKVYCKYHYFLIKEENKLKRKFGIKKINKIGYCRISGCRNKLSAKNKIGICFVHKELEKIRISKEKQK